VPTNVTTPWPGWVNDCSEIASPSPSVSLAITSTEPEPSSGAVIASVFAIGASATAVTVTVTVPVPVRPDGSVTVYSNVASPAKSVGGVKVMTPEARAAPLTAVIVSGSASPSVSLASSVATSIWTAVSSAVVAVSAPAIGASGTGASAIDTRPVSVSAPSLIVYSNVAVPVAFAAGVTVIDEPAFSTVHLKQLSTELIEMM
jgi:hypothetical protein